MLVFFFKQKTAYEMRISDWSSDVCSSDLVIAFFFLFGLAAKELHRHGCLRGFRRVQGALTEGLPGIWRFCWSTNFNMTLTLAFTHVGTLVVGWFLGPTDAALYRIARQVGAAIAKPAKLATPALYPELARLRSEEHTSEIQSIMRIWVAVFCFKTQTHTTIL